MRTVLVVTFDEVIELFLLLQDVVVRRFGGLILQGQMHPFVPLVLLRAAGLNALDANPKSQPPDGEPAEAEQIVR